MDPVTAIGLASGILSFVTFGSELISGAIKIHDAIDGHLEENRSRQLVIQEMKKLSERLLAPDDSTLVGQDKGLCILAAECQTLSNDLIALLERIKPKDPGSKAQSLWSALKNAIHEKEKLDLEQRLDRCRSQLELQITFLTSRETRASLDSLLSMAKTDNNTLRRLQGNIEQLGQGIHVSSISESAQRQLRELVGVQESVLDAITRQRILEAISFEGMNGRYNMVDDAYIKTFMWIFGDAYPRKMDEEDLDPMDLDIQSKIKGGIRPDHDSVETDENAIEMKRLAREKFMGWLSSQDGIFHISGKLGSGKSTLMRFLYEHHGTKSELEKWAGGRAVILAGFFFWNPGSDLQKSLAGLFRSILYSILEQCPELVPQILPAHWAKARAAPLQSQVGIMISEKEVQNAFNRLIRNKSLYERHCFCIFIDGLDEFQPTPQVDRKAMVDLLQGWADISPAVKLCVSSREDNVFMNAFSPERRFRLHELTKHDMRSYVIDKLEHLPQGESKNQLIDAIPERAQGIFLWVSVVSKSVREEFENGSSVESLWRMLEACPDELHDLFEHILRSLSRTLRRRAYQTLKMLLLSKEIGIGFYVVGYSFYEDYESDPDFAIRQDFKVRAAVVRGDANFLTQRTKMGEKQLNGWCRGLLEVIPEQPWEPAKVDYTHRSVAEFLEEESVRTEIARYTDGFDCTNAISQLALATQSHIDDPHIREPPINTVSHTLCRVYPEIMKHRHALGLDSTPPFVFLESLASLRSMDLPERFKRDRSLQVYAPGIKPQMGSFLVQVLDGKGDPRSWERPRLEHPLLIAARLRNYDYILWKLQQDEMSEVSSGKSDVLALLTFTLLWNDVFRTSFSHLDEPPELDWKYIESLFEQGLLQPDSLTQLQPFPSSDYFRGIYSFWSKHDRRPDRVVTPKQGPEFNVSIWDHMLVLFFMAWLTPSGIEPSYFAAFLEVFLRCSAGNSTFRASVEVTPPTKGLVELLDVEFEVEAEGETKFAGLRLRNDDMEWAEGLKRLNMSFRDVSGWDLAKGVHCKTFTVRSWVEYCTYQELPNRDRIIHLLDQRSRKHIQDISSDSDNHPRAISEIILDNGDGVNGHSHRLNIDEDDRLLDIKDRKRRGSLLLLGGQVRANYTPSSVFGVLLGIFILMVAIETAT